MPSTSACRIEREEKSTAGASLGDGAYVARRARSIERTIHICECMIDITSALFNVSGRELRLPGRSSTGVSRVRQIAMYVCHVVMGLTMHEVGRGFGRDRTTVLHACHVVEDLRDDPEFDRMVAVTERIARAALRNLENA